MCAFQSAIPSSRLFPCRAHIPYKQHALMPNYAYTHSYSYRLIKNSNFSKCSKRRKKHGNMNALRRQNYHLFVAVRTEAHVGVDPCVRMQRAVVRIYFVRMNLIIAHALDDCVGLLCRWSVRATSIVCVCVSTLGPLRAQCDRL